MFSREEMLFMIDALNGVCCSPETLGANLWGWVPYAGEKADRIEPNVLIGKVSRLSPAQIRTLHSQLEQFWEVGTIPDIDVRFREVGLSQWL